MAKNDNTESQIIYAIKPKKRRKWKDIFNAKYKKEYADLLLEHMSAGFSLWAFPAKIDVSPRTVYRWLHQHPEFGAAADLGKSKGIEFHEKIGMAAMVGKMQGFNFYVWKHGMNYKYNIKEEAKQELQEIKQITNQSNLKKLDDGEVETLLALVQKSTVNNEAP